MAGGWTVETSGKGALGEVCRPLAHFAAAAARRSKEACFSSRDFILMSVTKMGALSCWCGPSPPLSEPRPPSPLRFHWSSTTPRSFFPSPPHPACKDRAASSSCHAGKCCIFSCLLQMLDYLSYMMFICQI